MNILVTGAKGFVGRNLIAELMNKENINIFEYDLDSGPILLDTYTRECNFVYHLAGVNRPKNPDEYMKGNYGFSSYLLESLKKNNNKSPVLISSSIQAGLDNLYGSSKKASEDLLYSYSKETGSTVYVYRLPNIFGKWCRPNYNSVVATFCNNIARDLPIEVNDPSVILNLVYIDDVVNEFINALYGNIDKRDTYYQVNPVYTVKLDKISNLIRSFKESRENIIIPNMSNAFIKKLYSTYLSYLPYDKFNHPLKMNKDNRGSFTEFIKNPDSGQVSINISKPGITKGNHWHHSKNEKFLVVSGKGVIRLRKVGCDEVIKYFVSSDALNVIDIPPGYTHNIENTSDTDMVTIMWANEAFNPDKPDTMLLEV